MSRRAATRGGEAARRDPAILASLRSADPLAYGGVVERLRSAGIGAVHVDVADGRFVPYMTGSTDLAAAVSAAHPQLRVDVHLMTEAPEERIRDLAGSQVDRVAFHLEAERYPWRAMSLARQLGLEVGVAVNPATALVALDGVAGSADYVIILTTDPDFAGEPLLPGMVTRIRSARDLLGPSVPIVVDGGVSAETASDFITAGADRLVVGRAILEASDWSAAVSRLEAAVSDAARPHGPDPS